MVRVTTLRIKKEHLFVRAQRDARPIQDCGRGPQLVAQIERVAAGLAAVRMPGP